jgi:hypothetical protein
VAPRTGDIGVDGCLAWGFVPASCVNGCSLVTEPYRGTAFEGL